MRDDASCLRCTNARGATASRTRDISDTDRLFALKNKRSGQLGHQAIRGEIHSRNLESEN